MANRQLEATARALADYQRAMAKWRPGRKIPHPSAFAARHGISTSTIYRAIARAKRGT